MWRVDSWTDLTVPEKRTVPQGVLTKFQQLLDSPDLKFIWKGVLTCPSQNPNRKVCGTFMIKGIESLVREPRWTRGGDPVFEGWDLKTVTKHQTEICEKLRTIFFCRYDREAWDENLDYLRRLKYLDDSVESGGRRGLG